MKKANNVLCACCDTFVKSNKVIYQPWNYLDDMRVAICFSCSDILDYVRSRVDISLEALAVVFSHLNAIKQETK
jgi:hypothetical protein